MNYKIEFTTHKRKNPASGFALCGIKLPDAYDGYKRLYLLGKTDHCVTCLDCLAQMPNRTFYLVMTNCDCASHYKIMSNHPSRNKVGIKCPCCERILGPFQYGPIQTIRAVNWEHASTIFHGYHNRR